MTAATQDNPLAAEEPARQLLTKHEFKRLRSVTLPVLKMEPRQSKFIFFAGPMYVGKVVDKDKGAATLAHCLDMQTGEEGLFICSKVTQNELTEAYPKDAYVGRGFEISHTRVPDKRYNIVSLSEVSIPDALQAKATALQKLIIENNRAKANGAAAKS